MIKYLAKKGSAEETTRKMLFERKLEISQRRKSGKVGMGVQKVVVGIYMNLDPLAMRMNKEYQ